MENNRVVIIGAGPAGLTAGYLLTKLSQDLGVDILESDEQYVGGISRTFSYKGFCFDIGGHRFFSKSKEIEDLWTEILPQDMLDRPRSSRIYYRGKFFSYPLKAFDVLKKLGIFESILCVLSYCWAKLFPVYNPRTFEDWVSNEFGPRLFRIFFKTYTEKVWGMSCRDISADWAEQRIKGLSLTSAILSSLPLSHMWRRSNSRDKVIKTLIDSFRYPRRGPGMMWEAAASRIQESGGTLYMGSRAIKFTYESNHWIVHSRDISGNIVEHRANHIISSIPMREIVQSFSPSLPEEVLYAASCLKYRDFIVVALIIRDRDLFNDNWIYIHDPKVKVGRVQNFKSWSPEMVPDPNLCCYGLEYFCFENDGLWNSSDEELIELAKSELQQLGLAVKGDILDGCVVRQPKAYPVYDESYATHVETIRKFFEKLYPSFHFVGRNGMHKYNNQDHAMMTAMLTVKNIFEGKIVNSPWDVNQDAEYHESGETKSSAIFQRMIPSAVLNK